MLVQGPMAEVPQRITVATWRRSIRAYQGSPPASSEVLSRTAQGQTNAQIAEGLGVTVHAVKFHLSSIFRKLGVHNRTGAVAMYFAGNGTGA